MGSPPRRVLSRVLVGVLIASTPALASNGRLLTTDAAEVVDVPVLGLQRSAIALPAGFAVDTSLLGDLVLVLNGGLRWGAALDVHRLVLGARYSQFVGTPVYSALLNSQESQLQRYEPALSGPSFYGVYGIELGSLLLQLEGKVELMAETTASLTAGAKFQLTPAWGLIVEGGVRGYPGRVETTPPPASAPFLRGAAGLRFGGETGQVTLGVAYVGIEDPMLGSFPFAPVLDLAWSFR